MIHVKLTIKKFIVNCILLNTYYLEILNNLAIIFLFINMLGVKKKH